MKTDFFPGTAAADLPQAPHATGGSTVLLLRSSRDTSRSRGAPRLPGYVIDGDSRSWAESPIIPAAVEHAGSSRKQVLVAYNGSRTATAAIDVAADWIQAWSAETWVLYVRPWDRTRGSGRFFLETRSEARALAQTGVNRLCTKGVTATALVHDACRQRVAEAIVAQAEALGASCIVLGTHARGILSLAVLGSTSHAVLRKANRPVVLVKARDDRRLAADIGFD